MKTLSSSTICERPKMAIMPNHTIIMGPNNLPIEAVPNCCTKNKTLIMAITMVTMVCWVMSWNTGICLSPSMAEVTVMGGVIIPSANRAAPPIIAGITSHFLRLLTSAYKLKIPPSPLLSALKVRITYLKVVCSVSVQIIQDRAPIISKSLISLPEMISFKTYKGEVPMSP